MKGLLIKDYKLLMLQKKTFLLMLLIAICMNFAMQDNPGLSLVISPSLRHLWQIQPCPMMSMEMASFFC